MSLVRFKGGKELAQALRDLPAKLERQVLSEALVAGANVIAKEAKQNVPRVSGDLKRSIRVTKGAKKKKRKGIVMAEVKAGSKKAFYYAFVEFGTAAHIIKGKNGGNLKFTARDGRSTETPSVNHTGAIAKPYLRPALDAKNTEAVRAVGSKLTEYFNGRGVRPATQFEVE